VHGCRLTRRRRVITADPQPLEAGKPYWPQSSLIGRTDFVGLGWVLRPPTPAFIDAAIALQFALELQPGEAHGHAKN